MIEVPGTQGDLVLQATLLGAKRPSHMSCAFLENIASITAVDLIQQKKLDSWNFYDSNLMEARFDSLLFY